LGVRRWPLSQSWPSWLVNEFQAYSRCRTLHAVDVACSGLLAAGSYVVGCGESAGVAGSALIRGTA
jgi:hypothetical protein